MKNKGTLLLVGLLFGFTLPIQAHAIIATVTNTFVAGQKIVAQQVNQNFNDILSSINGQLTDQNMSPGGITNVSLASKTVSQPIIGDLAVGTGQIAAGAVTDAKVSGQLAFTKLASGSVGITATTSQSLNFSGAAVRVSTLSTSISTHGNPVIFGLYGGFGSPQSQSGSACLNRAAFTPNSYFSLQQNGATISTAYMDNTPNVSGTTCVPCGSIQALATASVNGTGTYSLLLSNDGQGTGTMSINACGLYAHEIP